MALEPDNNHIAIAGLETERSGHLHKSAEAQNRKTENMKGKQFSCRSGGAVCLALQQLTVIHTGWRVVQFVIIFSADSC